jgi:hypothetical protein
MARRRNRRRSGVFNLFSDLIDDLWDFIDDDILDRGRDTEWDLRQAGRNWFDDDDYDYDHGDDERGRPRYDSDDDRYRYRRRSRRRYRDDDLDDLHDAVAKLARKVRQIENSANKTAAPKATV